MYSYYSEFPLHLAFEFFWFQVLGRCYRERQFDYTHIHLFLRTKMLHELGTYAVEHLHAIMTQCWKAGDMPLFHFARMLYNSGSEGGCWNRCTEPHAVFMKSKLACYEEASMLVRLPSSHPKILYEILKRKIPVMYHTRIRFNKLRLQS